jgi:hypothetical protein
MASSLRILTCGGSRDSTDLSQVLSHIGKSLDVFMSHLRKLGEADDATHTFFGPFVGRSLLELSFTALIARLDPFRVLVLREMQRQPDFEVTGRRQASIQWQGDIVAKDAPKKPLWGDKKFEDISRALLADYYGNLYWNTALVTLLDQLKPPLHGQWLTELAAMDPTHFADRMKSEAAKNYSALSKGVHHEFLIPPENLYDRATVCSLLSDALRISSHLALASHMILHCPYCLPLDHAVRRYRSIEEIEVT